MDYIYNLIDPKKENKKVKHGRLMHDTYNLGKICIKGIQVSVFCFFGFL